MALLQQSERHIREYLDGLISASNLQAWLGDALPETPANEPAARVMADVWRLLSEYGYGHRDENSLRLDLSRMLPRTQNERVVSQVHFFTANLTATLTNMVPASVTREFVPPPPRRDESHSETHRSPLAVH